METKIVDTLEVMQKIEQQPGRDTVGDVKYKKMAVDSGHCQGDVAIIRRKKLPEGLVAMTKPNPQLAPGTDMGSHHIIAAKDMKHLSFFTSPRPGITEGPWIKATKAFTVTHPHHKHVTLPPGNYQVIYQREQGLNEIRRAID